MTEDRTLSALRRLSIIGLADHDSDVRSLSASILAFIENDEGPSLDVAIGLKPADGKVNWKTERARIVRNAYLKLAASSFCDGLSPRNAARVIRDAIPSVHAEMNGSIDCPASFRGTIREPIFYAIRAWPGTISLKYLADLLR